MAPVPPLPSPAELLAGVGEGDPAAWAALVERYGGLVWSVARSRCGDPEAAADVSQTVWLRLAEHCDRIREPDRLPSWLAATARNEAMRVSKLGARTRPLAEPELGADRTAVAPDERVEDAQAIGLVRAAFERLGESCRELLRLLTAEPPIDYQTIADTIGRPIGSIGPTRARCLDQLRALLRGATA